MLMSGKFDEKVGKASRDRRRRNWSMGMVIPAVVFMFVVGLDANNGGAKDPGVRDGTPGAGTPIAGLTANQQAFFNAGLADFAEIDSVSGGVPGTWTGSQVQR
jgi:hypothetical protein